ncbi:hypothetical protein D2V08_04045 [Flagellimonas lutimaris]|uniref:HTH cro/C1-type domain-containing protein n=1 Tax=Flagellimonas lutimaris TaxID=475082 RepID=A0A3A1N9V0_9FLAO|nr:hypothetical protein D2V08_04045 [Allomuricauda lutimaris]
MTIHTLYRISQALGVSLSNLCNLKSDV